MELKHLILQKIAELGEVMLNGFFPSKYPEARLWRNLLGAESSYKFSKPTFSAILTQLREEGFVKRKNTRKKSEWHITSKGLKHLQFKKVFNANAIMVKKDGIARIVCFDIPERERKKRRWIREELLSLGYQPLQKSVWLGFSPISEDFFKDLELLSLRSYIHIFSVDKKGTIEKTWQG
ncbi:MAG: CRISPR-associated endonuclease Cas2 [Candidatus Sungbacteria bacterium RIFCSPLOWO2_12_FULL_41_11]|uniref:CRISPR-associated endonuclease Cas2 n=1 Tax=Candidatus Sungbacteria bacterium RIFCSPLOWO2_12_FULL_41_11 TaxID=1802286 RepID=A0A1G2LSC5_9BACT|nr:MAG: CRISPR-associated endonuclease Cas2 [Candidatus Sungbacteria bacterium RIFCSPLOWO2_12_FULL_41_11]